MKWPTLYLRAVDQQAMHAALLSALDVAPDDEGNDQPVLITTRYQCVQRGPLQEPTGETDEDGLPVMQDIPGWHADILVRPDVLDAMRAALDAVVIDPEPVTPQYRFAGQAA